MAGEIRAGLRQVDSTQDMFHAAANFEKRGDYGTLILDRLGRILQCGTPAERIFRASRVRLIGKFITDFVSGLLIGGRSPSYSTRYLVHLCADGEWRKYEATDADGQAFVVELNLARVASAGPDPEMFLLNVRRPEMPAGGQQTAAIRAMGSVYLSGGIKGSWRDSAAADSSELLEGVARLGREWLKKIPAADPQRENLNRMVVLADDLGRGGEPSPVAMSMVRTLLCAACRRLNASSGRCSGQTLDRCLMLNAARS